MNQFIANVSDFGRLTLLQVPGKTACLSCSSEILQNYKTKIYWQKLMAFAII